ncbi:MAG: hypothetical protein MZV65_34165 [Chromatiales bacterium]|nr:hypothetical protein [Chromatiales bacterium]
MRTLIHGHTHRPAQHELTVDGAAGAAHRCSATGTTQGSVLVCDAGGCVLESLG